MLRSNRRTKCRTGHWLKFTNAEVRETNRRADKLAVDRIYKAAQKAIER